jgi:hypothetical protein
MCRADYKGSGALPLFDPGNVMKNKFVIGICGGLLLFVVIALTPLLRGGAKAPLLNSGANGERPTPSAVDSVKLITGTDAPARGTKYFVAPNGSDKTTGTQEKPFASLQRAQQAAKAGDTVFIRGGTYRIKESQIAERKGIFAYVIALNKSGSPGKHITYRAYQNEKPVFDFSQVKPAGLRVYAFSVTGSWLHLQGIEVTGVQVTIQEHTQSICFESNGSNNVFERLSMYENQAIGIYHVSGSNNLFVNCDAWNNYDYTSEGGKGGNVDGFGAHPRKGSTGNVFRGCRAWFNSDDGYDLIGAFEAVKFENCWAFNNGLSPQGKNLADGNGFKAGGYARRPASRLPNPIPRHTIRFCVAVGNKASGFYANHHTGGNDWFNNTAYRNGTNFNMLGRLIDPPTDVDGYDHKLRNNLGYKARRKEIDKIDWNKSDSTNNSFDLNLQIADTDFVNLDESELTRPRQANGELPIIGFLHPSPQSVFKDKGVDIGFPFQDAAPDLGAFEL